MSLKKYTDFENPNTTYSLGDNSNTTEVKSVIIDQKPITEEVLLTPKDNSNLGIEVLEEKIIKFNTGHIKDILETIKNKYSDTDYYIRKKDNELHIVKYNESLKLNINEFVNTFIKYSFLIFFVNTLLKFYSSNINSKNITEGIKVKGNQNFSIVENMKSQFSDKFVNDLTNLLSKKNK